MRKARLAIGVAIPLLVAVGAWLMPHGDDAGALAYRTGTVERGTVEAVVSATGTLSAVTTVQVGTQVSGQVSALYADFNDVVKKGQLLARIDPTLSEQAVAEAESGLARNRAELEKAQQERDRARQLQDAKVITEVELNTAEYQLAVAKANVRSGELALARARRNLAYTEIYAPIDGIVVERNVDVGQTVAASLSAPQIFLIAQDLSEMQILAGVDESDIAKIREGARVRFTVQAYQDRTFEGAVKQVRLQSATTENVVSYTAVVAVENPNRELLPGMTATVEFLTAVADDVLTVPNAAVRFRPSAELLASLGGERPRQAAAAGEARPAGENRGRTGTGAAPEARDETGTMAMLWYLGADGKLAALPARTGISDDQRTEVTGEGLREGMQVVVGTAQAGSTAGESAAANPFQQNSRQGAGGPPSGPPGAF